MFSCLFLPRVHNDECYFIFCYFKGNFHMWGWGMGAKVEQGRET